MPSIRRIGPMRFERRDSLRALHWRHNDEANTFVAKSASKLAAVEDEGPRWPGVSPKASATLAALRLTKLRINSPSKTYSDVSTLTAVKSFVVLHYTHMYYNTKSRRGANIWVTTRRKERGSSTAKDRDPFCQADG
ncbi:unnamed protein product [Trichogramma brassicae]|uniref:Uncharacterized protein n=1 Tax=Trichogramma brassicae TaxID=86971 RepID=A0A6H5HU44_9HYME|nr:unnamed protein product [Trichogramma brassicae]